MQYKEYQPHPYWQAYVDTYWYAKGSEVGISRIYPDGYLDLIFDLKGSGLASAERIRISGMMTSYRDVILDSETEVLGIRLKPSSLSLLQTIPVGQLKNASICLNEITHLPIGEWSERLLAAPGTGEKIHWIEQYLLPRLIGPFEEEDWLISTVCQQIAQQCVQIDISALARQYFISLRQLERRFKGKVGISMKEYQRVQRFSKALDEIRRLPEKSLLHIAFDNGYTDHAHLTREVSRMTGNNPSALRFS